MKELWLMGSPWPVFIILAAYLYFVLKAGPEFMKSRGPLNIDRIVMVYNISQILISLYIVKKAFQLLWFQDNYRINCIEIDYSDTDLAKDKIFITWIYFFSKVLDLLDTIFFVLRKKQNQVTFLHIYHHTMVLSFSWSILRIYPGGQVAFFGTINAFVHVIMYSYYFLSILKPAYKKSVVEEIFNAITTNSIRCCYSSRSYGIIVDRLQFSQICCSTYNSTRRNHVYFVLELLQKSLRTTKK